MPPRLLSHEIIWFDAEAGVKVAPQIMVRTYIHPGLTFVARGTAVQGEQRYPPWRRIQGKLGSARAQRVRGRRRPLGSGEVFSWARCLAPGNGHG